MPASYQRPENEAGDHARQVREMFSRIAARYDLLNHLLSGATDVRWRRKLAEIVAGSLLAESRVLDVACGTGDLAFAVAYKTGARVAGVDFCRPMLELAAAKAAKLSRTASLRFSVEFAEGDALRLPFSEGVFDVVTIGFGLRNFEDVEAGLRELRRVTKRGGVLAVLEFSRPVIPGFREAFQFYFNRVLPAIGGLISGSRQAYQYLPASVYRFPDQPRLQEMMQEAGFGPVKYTNLTGGIAAIHLGCVPGSPVIINQVALNS